MKRSQKIFIQYRNLSSGSRSSLKEVYFDGKGEKEIAALIFRIKLLGTVRLLCGIYKTDREPGVEKSTYSSDHVRYQADDGGCRYVNKNRKK